MLPPSDTKADNNFDTQQLGPDPRHPYCRRKLGSPCPAISAMINHSYLKPKDEKDDISICQLARAMVECYNLTWNFAIIFSILGTFALGRWTGFNIIELGVHGKVEHDASISRFNASEGDALNPNSALVEDFLNNVNSSTLNEKGNQINQSSNLVTLEDFARQKVKLESRLKRFLPSQPKSTINFLGRGESCLALLANSYVDKSIANHPISTRSDWLRVWFTDERLPVELGWRKPNEKIGLRNTLAMMAKMEKLQKSISPSS
ncbi:hypothetical protein CROQUDRAFT_88996 [Cronartium quercuum f. sp. fusiforme G11]|uniref:Heme haloperoxidase family profile domain-containing protein n=1 Tax=Cronartium quercuum f. sp. fusiforme G11 TaxID=708437 RepID=A0A9P6NM55_9BASI|nr:hypothetical protein CROQUDRAFT_88996 [Cronartium quercuum f. sp. fusiforme G11]